MSKITIVDKDDNPIGSKDRAMLAAGDIYRVASLWLTNSQGHILMAMRSKQKKNDPGTWGPCVAGTVEEDETYDSNMVKEIQEEIGLTVSLSDLRKGPNILIHGRKNPFFNQWYFYSSNKHESGFTLEPEEVEAIRWFTKKELEERVNSHPDEFISTTHEWLGTVLGK